MRYRTSFTLGRGTRISREFPNVLVEAEARAAGQHSMEPYSGGAATAERITDANTDNIHFHSPRKISAYHGVTREQMIEKLAELHATSHGELDETEFDMQVRRLEGRSNRAVIGEYMSYFNL